MLQHAGCPCGCVSYLEEWVRISPSCPRALGRIAPLCAACCLFAQAASPPLWQKGVILKGSLPEHRTALSSYMPLPTMCMSGRVQVIAMAVAWLKVADAGIGTPTGPQLC